MSRIRFARSQCPSLADGATMRVSLVPPSFSPYAVRRMVTITDPSPRLLHRSLIHTNDSNIFPNDLQKTLEAHRSSNRASLIRKVVPRTFPKGAPPSTNPSDGHVRKSPSNEKSSSEAPIRTAHSVKASSGRKRRPTQQTRVSPETTLSLLSSLPNPTKDDIWNADSKESLPEVCPWLDYIDSEIHPSDAVSHLDAEIRALEKYMIPTPRERAKVDTLVATISGHLAGIVPHPPEIIGSWRTGFASSHSDLDLMLPVEDAERSVNKFRNPSPTRPKILDVYGDLLGRVALALAQNPTFSQVHPPKKGIPMTTAVHSPTGLQLKFCCGDGLPPSVEYTRYYYTEYPAVRPLYMASRVILEARGMLGAHRSSIGSGALLMLLIAFLKMNHGRFQRSGNLGEQLLAILETYGTNVDLKTTGVSVDPPGFFNEDTVEEESIINDGAMAAHLRGQRSLLNLKETAARRSNFPNARRLCIQDPSDYMRNLGRSCTRTAELQKTLACAYDLLQISLEAWKAHGNNPRRSILVHALRANFDRFQAKRTQLSFSEEQYSQL
ncbi:hypothetical protein PHISCL_00992 [Aspergillus sclerotialis]|uniref:PAP-associated domain-containing protein n=1 Tax=Aspergillus sclerotialis TaxID=2070753 RepID=A0A3A2ZU26_9EURO|nr:hypothetical protein PHISCL_00992 [Aspergillus sclerotialis]